MSLDPQIEAMLAGAGAWPGARSLPVEQLRALVRQFSIAGGPLPVPLGGVTDRTIPGPAGELKVRIYAPQGQAPLPLLVYFHGGGYVTGDLDTQDMIARALCFGAGAVVMSVDYRLAPEHPFPAATDDAFAALQWAAANAGSIGGDARRLSVAGDSAGANLSAAVAIMAREAGGPALSSQALFYGSANYPDEPTPSAAEFANGPILTLDDVDYFWAQYLRDPGRERDDYRASPVRAATLANLPPAFVATAECDPTRDDAERFGDKLAAAGVSVERRRYAGMPHGFVSWVGLVPAAQQAVDDACDFLKTWWEAT